MSAPPKRPLFNKPAWSNPSKIGAADDLFHRSNQTYLKVAAEAEARRKRKTARLQREHESEKADERRPGKRRCVSDDSEDDSDSSGSEENPNNPVKENIYLSRPQVPTESENGPSVALKTNLTSKTPLKSLDDTANYRKPDQASASFSTSIVDLEDEVSQPQLGDGEDSDLELTVPKVSRPAEDDGLPSSDEEFPELAKKAREKAKRKRLEADSISATQNSTYAAEGDSQSQRSKGLPESIPPCPPSDPVIQILITSPIPDTEPLIVGRRISQRLKDVRLAWCARQPFKPEFIPTVFLTWRGNRLFDVTTCKSLGIAVDSDGDISLKGRRDVMGEEDRQIHMEAVTEEILAERQRSKSSVITENIEQSEVEEVFPDVKVKEAQLRIILKARGFADFKLIVKPVRTPMFVCIYSLLMAFSLP